MQEEGAFLCIFRYKDTRILSREIDETIRPEYYFLAEARLLPKAIFGKWTKLLEPEYYFLAEDTIIAEGNFREMDETL